MIELISIPALLARPRYDYGVWWDMRTHWTRPDFVALTALCDARASITKSADALGRPPETLIDKVRASGLTLPPEWRVFERPRKKRQSNPREAILQYPYIRNVRGEHADLLAVNSIVPRSLPDPLRADVCQEIMLALWQKEITLDEMKAERGLLREFIKRSRNANFEAGGQALSLDVPMRDGRNWYDVLPDPATEFVP